MKKNNKGFSLVELIIVIAIMAILAGAIAPALIRYIDKSRKSNDVTACKTIKTAIDTAMSNEDVNEALTPEAKKVTVIKFTEKADVSGLIDNTDAGIAITLGNSAVTAGGDEEKTALSEIAKNLGGKNPKLSYKKAGKEGKIKPEAFYAVIDENGTIYVGIGGGTAPSAAPKLSETANTLGWYIIVPEICKDYEK